MRNLLPFLLVLACPLMMIFMMRGMRGGHDNSGAGHDRQIAHDEGQLPDVITSDERIADLEREVASLRALRDKPSDHRGGCVGHDGAGRADASPGPSSWAASRFSCSGVERPGTRAAGYEGLALDSNVVASLRNLDTVRDGLT